MVRLNELQQPAAKGPATEAGRRAAEEKENVPAARRIERNVTAYDKINVAIECALVELRSVADKLGLKPQQVMGLMYLPDPAVTRQWQEAGRAVLAILGVSADEE